MPLYPKLPLAGYSGEMLVEASETLFSPTTLLWLVVSAMAAVTLFGALHRRRGRLTEALRQYVDQQQKSSESAASRNQESSED